MQGSKRFDFVSTEATVHRRRFPDLGDVARNFGAVFADPKAIFGIKLGLAGLLALYLSLLIGLEYAKWALFTVLVLAPAQYVGAIAQRSIARVVGTNIFGRQGMFNMELEHQPHRCIGSHAPPFPRPLSRCLRHPHSRC